MRELTDPSKGRQTGLVMAAAGTLVFSMTFPATQKAILSFDPWTVGIGRAVAAAVPASICLLCCRARRPERRHIVPLLLVSAGVVVGFPAFSALALEHVNSSHAAIVAGLLPLATAIFGRFRGNERPSALFWWASGAGAVVVAAYALRNGIGRVSAGDLLLLGALVTGGMGYAEGGIMSREMAGWKVISWALVISLPITVPVTAASLIIDTPHKVSAPSLAGFGYVALFSMFLGFFAWYSGLARAGVTRGSQVQLLQPLLTVGWAALLLSESVGAVTLVAAVLVVVCVGLAQLGRVPERRVPAASGTGARQQR